MSLLSLLPIMIASAGTYFLFKLRFFFIAHPLKTGKCMIDSVKRPGAFRALMLALAGTLGVGNIVGVAFGISVGGAGSLFWMVISGVFAAVIKYCEAALASSFNSSDRGGMMFVLKASFCNTGHALGVIYSCMGVGLAFFMGAALQSKAAVDSANIALGIPPFATSLFFTVLVAVVILSGTKKITMVTSYLIPLTTIIYIFMSLLVIFCNFSRLPGVINEILSSAFTPNGAVGGVLGCILSSSVRTGFLRGMLSNEAGAGTSAMAQTTSHGTHPSETGLLGMCEVFFDTVLLCSLTGISVLVALPELDFWDSGTEIVSVAFSSALGTYAAVFLFVVLFSFAFSTVICWYFYGSVCLEFLFDKRESNSFNAFFLLFCLIGFMLSDSLLIAVSDYFLFFMTVLTLICLIKNSERIKSLSENSGLLKKSDMGKWSNTEG